MEQETKFNELSLLLKQLDSVIFLCDKESKLYQIRLEKLRDTYKTNPELVDLNEITCLEYLQATVLNRLTLAMSDYEATAKDYISMVN
jgi:hypothetical protein